MNFIKNTHHNLILFFLLLLAFPYQKSHCQNYTSSWQAHPLFTLPAPFPEHPISMVQDPSGILYLTADNAVYRFDGNLSQVATLPGPLQLGCTSGGSVLIAGRDSLWILHRNREGSMHTEPLMPPSSNLPGLVLKMVSLGKDLLIAFPKNLYRYASSRLSLVPLQENIKDLIALDENSALVFTESGLLYLASDQPVPCIGQLPPRGIVPGPVIHRGNSVLFLADGQWYSCKGRQVEKFNPPSSFSRLPARLEQAVNLNAEEVLTRLENGNLAVLDIGLELHASLLPALLPGMAAGELFMIHGYPVIFQSGNFYRLFPLFNCTQFPASYTGIQGPIRRLAVSREEIILESATGLWSATVSGKPGHASLSSFRKCLGTGEKILDLKTGNNRESWLITSRGVAFWNKGNWEWLLKDKHFTAGGIAPGLNKLVVVEENTLLVYSVLRSPLQIREEGSFCLPDTLGNIRSCLADSSGNAWLQTDQDAWLRCRLKEKSGFELHIFPAGSFSWTRGFSRSSGILLLSASGPQKVDPAKQKLTAAFPSLPLAGKNNFYFPLAEDPDTKNLWLVLQNENPQEAARIFRFSGNDSLLLQTELPACLHLPISALAAGNNSTLWIASGSDLIWFDPASRNNPLPAASILLTGLWTNKDTLKITADSLPEKEMILPAGTTELTIQAQNAAFAGPASVRYRFQLSGTISAATSWSRNNTCTFSNLRPGSYTLRIESLVLPAEIPAVYESTFTIEKPWWSRWYALGAFAVLAAIFILLYIRWRSWHFMQEKIRLEEIVSTRTEEITLEKEKSEQLLANILPKETADELKKKGKASSQKYDLVTVLFSDIQGFTRIAEQMNPETLIDQLDTFYFQFDSVVEKYNIEKIKTIGDAYMCAGGIPDKNRTNPVEVVLAGLEMQQFMKDLKATNANIWDLRIGIHTGPVIAGVVGHKKFSYDIWGDTVNVASRMESSGEAGKVNISGHTYELVRDFFICEYRGRMPVKYKGEIDMYFVKGIRPELSLNLKGLPNRHFFIQLQNLRLMDLEEFIVERLEKCDTASLHFHNLNYTIDVYTQCELLGRAEELSGEELIILRTAGLLQGIGYISEYQDAAQKSIAFAAEVLPSFKYELSQIETILSLLRSVKDDGEPVSRLEKIFSDARLNYLGRPDYPSLSLNLLKELNSHGKQYSEEDWIRRQEKFLSQHQFHTNAARRLREYDEGTQIRMLRELILNRRQDLH